MNNIKIELIIILCTPKKRVDRQVFNKKMAEAAVEDLHNPEYEQDILSSSAKRFGEKAAKLRQMMTEINKKQELLSEWTMRILRIYEPSQVTQITGTLAKHMEILRNNLPDSVTELALRLDEIEKLLPDPEHVNPKRTEILEELNPKRTEILEEPNPKRTEILEEPKTKKFLLAESESLSVRCAQLKYRCARLEYRCTQLGYMNAQLEDTITQLRKDANKLTVIITTSVNQ